MKLGIMQPYFLPYIGYISLIKHTDTFILLDEVQFIRHGWIERNRILKPAEGWQYIQVPIQKHHQTDLIKNVKINNEIDWERKILAQIEHYKKKALNYRQVIDLLQNIFSKKYTSIVELNKETLNLICKYLSIQTDIYVFSEMNLTIEPVLEADDWALNISKALNANEYINPPGGVSIFNKDKYEKANIGLKFLEIIPKEYLQKTYSTFEPGLSILDVLMFNSVEETNELLEQYKLV
jgi:hypothetical protein